MFKSIMKKTYGHSIWVCLLSLFLVGCASTAEIGSASLHNGKAKIYVLRRLTALGRGGIGITENGNRVGKIDRGGILQFETAPGEVVIEASGAGVSKLTLAVEGNNVYFVEVRKARVAGTHSREVEIRPLSNAEGARLLEMNREEGDPQRGMRSL
jgi:hypothetical protein